MHIGRIAVEVSVLSASLIGPSLIGDPTVAAETNEQPGVDVASIVGYLEALSTVDASPALAVASPRSPAWRYAEHQVAFEVALRENGSAPAADIISPLSDGRFQS